jgi:hypothetical protein
VNFSQYIDLRGKSIRIDGLKEGGGFNGATARTMYGLLALKGVLMVISVDVSIKEIVLKGRDFPWLRPAVCPRCDGNRVWGHGFVAALFDGFDDEVLLRRYRCPDCHCVLRLRPSGYFKRFQASIDAIRSSIAFRLEKGRWPPGSSRTRQSHWLRSLYRKTFAYCGQAAMGRLLQRFDFLVWKDEIPVSRRI